MHEGASRTGQLHKVAAIWICQPDLMFQFLLDMTGDYQNILVCPLPIGHFTVRALTARAHESLISFYEPSCRCRTHPAESAVADGSIRLPLVYSCHDLVGAASLSCTHCHMCPSDCLRSPACAIALLWFVVAILEATASASEKQIVLDNTLQVHRRSLTAETTECYTAETAAASVNTTVQLQVEQQLTDQEVQQDLVIALSQYLRVSNCNVKSIFSSSTVCPATITANSNYTCADGQYICRGVVQVPQDLYTAVQENQCTPDISGSAAICQGSEVDLTTYLSIQQGQCCLQCPGQQQCTADASEASQNTSQTAAEAYNCGSFEVSIAVGSSLDGSFLEDLLATAVSDGLLELYLQTSGLPDASVLSVGPTGNCFLCLALGVLSVLFVFLWTSDSSCAEFLFQDLSIQVGLLMISTTCSTKMSST